MPPPSPGQRRRYRCTARRRGREKPMLGQRTLKNSIRAQGVGLHTGKKVLMTLRPAAPDTGIVFRRTDLEPPVDIPAKAENVGDTQLGTTLINGDGRVSTVEHLLSAFAGLGIDNAHRRGQRAGSAHHGRQRRSVRVPAAVGRYRRAAHAEAIRAHQAARARGRRRQVGGVPSLRRLQGELRNRVQSPAVQAPRAEGVDGFLHDLVPEGSQSARAPSASCATSR